MVVLLLTALAAGCDSNRDGKQHASLLSLPYAQFDQAQGAGWRAMADRQQFYDGAVLIEAYLPRHPELSLKEIALLHFHAAQLLAVSGREAEALVHLEQAAIPDSTPGTLALPARWNDFVAATRAFLSHDRSELIDARTRMSSGPSTSTDRFFLRGIDLLVSHFGETYRDVYLGELARSQRQTTLLNELRDDVNANYGYRQGLPRINYGPCGRFAKIFREQWNARFREKVNLAFVMSRDGSRCHHVLIKFPNNTFFDGGNGVLSEEKILTLYPSDSTIEEMTEFDLSLLDQRVGGLDHSYYRDCPNYSDDLTRRLIDKHLAVLPTDIDENERVVNR